MRKELFTLRDKRWEVEGKVHDIYDFGMVELNCEEFKGRLVNHIVGLIDHLEVYVKSDFTTK